MNQLSRSGQVTLAKSVVNVIPIYTMHNLWLPEIVYPLIWARSSYHWVNKKNLLNPNFIWGGGGLGIRTTMNSNISFLGKHIWDILHEPQKHWVEILRNMYLGHSYLRYLCILLLSKVILAFGVK